jgi:hypothetical protein
LRARLPELASGITFAVPPASFTTLPGINNPKKEGSPMASKTPQKTRQREEPGAGRPAGSSAGARGKGKKDVSVAAALGRAHAALLNDLRRLEEAARPPSGAGPADLGVRLAATQAHLTQHFRFEEHDGYMDAVRKRELRLERTVQQLADEHRELAQSLEALLQQARGTGEPDDKLCDAVRAWVGRVRGHEARENALIQHAFNVDIGAED